MVSDEALHLQGNHLRWGWEDRSGNKRPREVKRPALVTQLAKGVGRVPGGMVGGSSVLDGHGALAVGQIHHDEAVGVGLGGHAGLGVEQAEGGPGGDGLLEAAQAAAAVREHEVVEGVGLELRDELLGRAAVHVQGEPVVLDLRAGAGSAGAGLTPHPDRAATPDSAPTLLDCDPRLSPNPS